jgi:phosphoribosylformylglycinamidine cyclo-ligase
MTNKSNPNDPYAKAGVNIDDGNALIKLIKSSVNATHNKSVMGGIGGFAGLYELNHRLKKPTLVACTDGVGTKVTLSKKYNTLGSVGQDLVAMCVNDMASCGATPLFFLDYFASSKLELKETATIIKGIARACKKINMALLGGETAEMPGHYTKGNFDIAGFAVGVVDKSKIISGKKIKTNHVILGIESSGPHSNGYSLIRKILSRHKPPPSVLKTLLKPTHLYTPLVNDVVKKNIKVSGIANITGGGITENIPRIIPKHLAAEIDLNGWKFPKAFQWLQEKGKISHEDMLRIFNCGIGLAVILPLSELKSFENLVGKYKFKTYRIGKIVKRTQSELTYLN